MKKQVGVVINVALIASMVLALLAPASAAFAQSGPGPIIPVRPVGEDVTPAEGFSAEAAVEKIDPSLRDLAKSAGKDLVDVYISVQGGADVTPYLQQVLVRPAVFGGIRSIYGKALAADLMKIASQPDVLAVVNSAAALREKPYDPEMDDENAQKTTLKDLKPGDLKGLARASSAAAEVGSQGWFDVQDGHKSKAAWQKGFTGKGVIVGVLDDGIDFGHPDLQGTYAWVTDPASPYYGWPMAFSQVSTRYFAEEVKYQNQGSTGISKGWAGSRWADTSTTATPDASGLVSYKPVGYSKTLSYHVTGTSQSGTYKLGSLNDENLLDAVGYRPAVLVVDEHTAGVYDTVYVDLDYDQDFANELPATRDSPEIYADWSQPADGIADVSGGMLTWISDGKHVPPTTGWLWGLECGDEVGTLKACPDNGSLLIFAGAFSYGYTHGTQCASNIAAQGKVSGGLSAQPFLVGGMVQGAAPNVGLMDFGNHYYSGTDEDEFIVAALGYDGVSDSGDEVQITSNSYGSFTQMWGGWGYIGRLITALNTTLAPTTVWVFSAGNEGPGYGPQEGENGPTIIKAGSSTQYGSTAWDSAMDANQIMYGDPSSFYSHGPNRDGSSGVDLLGNGGRGAGDEGLNYFALQSTGVFDGKGSWATWGGTSRSGPVLAGNLALLYEAFKKNNGRWPTWEEVKAISKSSATNVVSSPFLQGGGVMNADRATDVAGGIYGFYATPDEWQVGNWKGSEYLNFANVAEPGASYTKEYTLTNPGDYDLSLSLSDDYMKLINKYEFEYTTAGKPAESGFNFHAPDYLVQMDASKIPADAEVMIVRYVQPYDNYDQNLDYTSIENSWRFMLYNWTDQNGNGKLWTDKNGNGAVNHADLTTWDNDGFHPVDYSKSEIEQGEYVRVDYEFGGIGIPIIVHDPIQRMANGYFFGFQHRAYGAGAESKTTFKIGVEFYKKSDLTWLKLDQTTLDVAAKSSTTFTATAEIPADAKPGIYEGVILVNDPGNAGHTAHETALPVVSNVIAALPDGGSLTLGGESSLADSMYQNSFTNGYFNWYGGGWTGAGDWRHYFLDLDQADVDQGNLLVHTSWQNKPTDINTWVLGPTPDCASNAADPCAWYQPGLGQPRPKTFGPYTLAPIAGPGFLAGAAYPFKTTTGGPDDWTLAPLTAAGLHEIALHNVVYAGKDLAEPFKVEVGTLNLQASMDPAYGTLDQRTLTASVIANQGTLDFNFTPSLVLPDLKVSLAGGLAEYPFGPLTVANVPYNGGTFSAWNAKNATAMFKVDQAGATKLIVNLSVSKAGASQDADLFLVYDANNDGVMSQANDTVVGSSGNSAGTDETITLNNPPLGNYWISIAGYAITPQTGIPMDWGYNVTAPGPIPTEKKDIVASGPVSIDQDAGAFDPATSTAYSVPVTVDARSAAIYADLTGIDAGSNIDLYLTDSTNKVVAKSETAGSADEHLALKAVDPAYRLTPGAQYKLWVVGASVTGTITPTLHIYEDALNFWLSTTQPEVTLSAIGPGQSATTATATLHYDRTTWNAGQSLAVRLLAEPSVLPGAFDELVTLTKPAAPVTAANFSISTTLTTPRGPSPVTFAGSGLPANPPVGLLAPGETATFTTTVKNTGDAAGDFYFEDYWGDTRLDLSSALPAKCSAAIASGWELLACSGSLNPGETYTLTFTANANTLVLGKAYAIYSDVYDNADPDNPAFLTENWAVVQYRDFTANRFDGLRKYSEKTVSSEVVNQRETFDYTISLVNPSAVDKTLYVTDVLPPGVNLANRGDMTAYDGNKRTLTWSGVVPGSSVSTTSLTYSVTASPIAPNKTRLTNTAIVALTSGGAPIASLSVTNEIDDGLAPDLMVTSRVDKVVASHGDTVKYFHVVTNSETAATTARAAVLETELPAGLVLDTVNISSEVSAKGSIIRWTGSLAPGESATISYSAKVAADTPVNTMIYSTARAWAGLYPAVTSSAHTEVVAADPLNVAFDKAAYPVFAGQRATLDAVVSYSDTATYVDEVLADGLVILNPSGGADLSGMVIEGYLVNGTTETKLGSLTLAPGQTSFWLSQLSPAMARASLKLQNGITGHFRFKVQILDNMAGVNVDVTAQLVGATEWNFDDPASWVVSSPAAHTALQVVATPIKTYLPAINR